MSTTSGTTVRERAEIVEVDAPDWVGFVATRPEATCFHQPAWTRTLAECYRFRCFAVVQRDPTGAVVAGLPLVEVHRPAGPRRWSALPFSDECGPLVAPGASASEFLAATDVLRRRSGVADLQVRAPVDLPGTQVEQVGLVHELTLGPATAGAATAGARASTRRHVATARRAGVGVRAARSVADLDTYYGLHVLTRRRQGVPVQPRRYFRLLWHRVIAPGGGVVLLADVGGRTVAGAVYLLGGRTVTYKYGASDAESWPLRPNHAVMAEAMKWAQEHGCTTFDFGRTETGNAGLAQFKESWGALPRPLRYTRFSPGPASTTSERALAALGPVLRRAPAFVCRGAGELLYRYAA